MNPSTPIVIAHRGASYDKNENSARALRRARSVGANAIEIDVHRSNDGAVILHHDEDLTRGCGDSRRIADLSRAELRELGQRFESTVGLPRQAEPILDLDEALSIAAPLPLVVEIKAGTPDPRALTTSVVAALTRDGNPAHRIISFEREVVDFALAMFDPFRVGLIRNTEYGEEGWRDLLAPACGIAVLSRRIATPPRVSELLAGGRVVYVYALDDASSVLEFAAMGAIGIISNRPDVARAALRTLKNP